MSQCKTKTSNYLCDQLKLRSAWAPIQCDPSLYSSHKLIEPRHRELPGPEVIKLIKG